MIIIQRFFEICFFKASPADVPASGWLMKLCLLTYFCLSLFVNSLEYGAFVSFVGSLCEILVLLLLVHLYLQLTGFAHRYLQTVTAMAGCAACISIVGTPLVLAFHFFAGGEDVRITVLTVWLMMLLMFWNIAVNVHIFKQAMNMKTSSAVLASLTYSIVLTMAVRFTLAGVM